MNARRLGCFLWLLVGLPIGGMAAAPAFDRYGVILERKPFGEEAIPPPLGSDVVKPPLPPEQSFTAKFKMAAVTRDDKGVIRVGLVDLKSNGSYMLGIGDSIEGVQVIEADYVRERARLCRDPEDYWVSMIGGSNHFEIVRKETPVPAVVAPSPAPAAGTSITRVGTQKSSYRVRSQSREEARIRKELARLRAEESERLAKAKAEKTASAPSATVASVRAGKKGATGETAAPLSETGKALLGALARSEDSDLTQEEVDALIQEYQKELIRSGQPPLPVPLTPETDRDLVEEGVLPAQE